MSKTNLSKITRNVSLAVKRHQPEILTGLGIAGMVTTTIMAVRATPKALDLMAEVKAAHECDTDRKAFSKDVITKVAPVYIPATIVGGLSIACLIGATSVNLRRNAALATAYSISETALREYQEKVVETIGDKKEREVRDAIAKDKVEQNPVVTQQVILTEKGSALFLDVLSKRWFRSDRTKIEKAINELNRRMRQDNYITLNEYYAELGLDDIEIGYDIGWDIDHGYIEPNFSAQLTDDGEAATVIGHYNPPRHSPDY